MKKIPVCICHYDNKYQNHQHFLIFVNISDAGVCLSSCDTLKSSVGEEGGRRWELN